MMLGLDALGRPALGQISNTTVLMLTASVGAFSYSGNAAFFKVAESAGVGLFSVAVLAISFATKIGTTPGAYTVTGNAAAFSAAIGASPSSYLVTGNAANLDRDHINWIWHDSPTSTWGASGLPSQIWTSANISTTTWTDDPAEQILPPEVH